MSMPERCAGIPSGKMMNGVPLQHNNRKNPIPEQVTKRRLGTEPPGHQDGGNESETSKPPASQIVHLSKRVKGWE